MHEIDDQVLVNALAAVIKGSINHEGEWAYAQNCLKYPITSDVLLAKHWTVLEITSPDKLSRQFERADFVFMENIVFHAIQKYVQIKKSDDSSLRVSENDRDRLRSKIVECLPDAFSSDELKTEWIQEKKEMQRLNLSGELKCALRYAYENAAEVLKRVHSLSLEEKRNVFILEIHALKEDLKKIESDDHLTLFPKKINDVKQIRERLKTLEVDFEREGVFLQKIQESMAYIKSLITEVSSLVKMMTALVAENKSKLMRNQKISDQYTRLVVSLDQVEKKFSTVCQNGLSQDLPLIDKELRSMLKSVCELQKEGSSLFSAIQDLRKQVSSESKIVRQGVFRTQFLERHQGELAKRDFRPPSLK